MNFQTCWKCGFTETDIDTMLEDCIELTNIDGEVEEEFILVCPNCNEYQN